MTDASEEWGPWIEHDGSGCPVPVGTRVQGVYRSGKIDEWNVGRRMQGEIVLHSVLKMDPIRNAWSWAVTGNFVREKYHVIRYRVRQFRAMEELRRLAEAPRKTEDA